MKSDKILFVKKENYKKLTHAVGTNQMKITNI